jgi:hypothetical protein
MPCKICRSWDASKKECHHNPPLACPDPTGKQARAFPRTDADDWCETGFQAVLLESSRSMNGAEFARGETPDRNVSSAGQLPDFGKLIAPEGETPQPKRRVPMVMPSAKKTPDGDE